VPTFARCLLYNVHAVRLAVSPDAKIQGVVGWAKTRQPFSAVSEPKFNKFGRHLGESL